MRRIRARGRDGGRRAVAEFPSDFEYRSKCRVRLPRQHVLAWRKSWPLAASIDASVSALITVSYERTAVGKIRLFASHCPSNGCSLTELAVVSRGVSEPPMADGTEPTTRVRLCAQPIRGDRFHDRRQTLGIAPVTDNRIHVLVPHGASPELEHRRSPCRKIDDIDIVSRDDGIRLTSHRATLFDSADMLGFSACRSAMEQLLHEKRCTLGTITAIRTSDWRTQSTGYRHNGGGHRVATAVA